MTTLRAHWQRHWPLFGLAGTVLLALIIDAGVLRPAPGGPGGGGTRTPLRPDAVLFTPYDNAIGPTLEQIKAARYSIDVAQYRIDDQRIWLALIAAVKRGVHVRVVTHWYARQCPFCEPLMTAGAELRKLDWELHHKYATFDSNAAKVSTRDGAVLINGSGNWSPNGFERDDEDWLRFAGDSDITRAFQNEFEWMWAHAHTPEGKAGSGQHPRLKTSNDPPVRFSSWNGETRLEGGRWRYRVEDKRQVARWLIEAIDGAEESLRLAQLLFHRTDIYEALARAVKRGVKVQLLFAGKQYHPGLPALDGGEGFDEHLAKAGAEVRYKIFAFPPQNDASPKHVSMHMKYTIVDDQTVYTGSYNLTEYSQKQTMENMLRIDDAEIAARYRGNFEQIWSQGRERRAALVKVVNQKRGMGPCSFDAMVLDGQEIAELRSHFRAEACP